MRSGTQRSDSLGLHRGHGPALRQVSRRTVLRTLLGTALVASPFHRANAIEPITALQAAGAVVSIVAGLAGMSSDSSLRKGIDQILGRLDVVIANQELILA